jgi:hypothetical protein
MIPIPSSRPASPSGQPECSVQGWRGCPTFVAWGYLLPGRHAWGPLQPFSPVWFGLVVRRLPKGI